MTMSFAQNEPAVAPTCCSSAQRARSDHSLCQPRCAAHPGSPSDRLPKNLCNSVQPGKPLESSPKAFDNFSHCGRQSHRRRLDDSAGKGQSRPLTCWLFSKQMTIFHPTLGSFAQAHQGLVGAAPRSRAGARRLFLSQELTVFLATPKVRVKPRKEECSS